MWRIKILYIINVDTGELTTINYIYIYKKKIYIYIYIVKKLLKEHKKYDLIFGILLIFE